MKRTTLHSNYFAETLLKPRVTIVVMTVFSVVLTGGVFLLLILLLRRTQLAERGLELMTQLSGYSDRPYTVVQRRLLLLQNTLYSGVTDPDVLEKQYMVLSQYMHGLTLPSQRLNMMTEEIAADTDSLIQQWRNVLKPMLIFLIENPKNDSLREKVIDIADALEIGFFNLSTRNENARRIRERQWASNTRAVLYGMRQIFLSLAGTGVVVVLFVVFVIINISQFIREREIANQKLVQLNADLESRVANRTRDLRIASDVARQITTVLEIDRLLRQVVVLTGKAFKVTSLIFLSSDTEPEKLTIAAGADADGKDLPAEVLAEIPLSETSPAAVVVRTRETLVSEAISPLSIKDRLSYAKSELAIPMILGGHLLGVFDFRSSEPQRFTEEEQRVLRTLAEQTAIAVRNAQSFTEVQNARSVAEVANRAKSDFLAQMSHELRTPLNAILGYAQILKRDPIANERQIDGLSIIYNSGNHLLTLIDDILDLAKIEAGKTELQPTDVPLSDLLERVVRLIQVRAEQMELEFMYQTVGQLPNAIRVDKKRLQQVLLNLLSNAVKFTEKGSVTFRVIERGSRRYGYSLIRFEVEDTGIGMTPSQLKEIFSPFKQVGDIRQRVIGTGLGLAISQRLATLMGSSIEVVSEPGRGSKFWTDLDLEVTTLTPEEEGKAFRSIIGYEGKRRKVLVVDDEKFNRSVLVQLLGPMGFEMVEANNGAEGIEKAAAYLPDVILMDLVMPGTTGFDAVEKIRQMPNMKEIPIIAMSASAFPEDRRRSLQAGSDAFLPKPIDIEELFNMLETFTDIEWVRSEQLEKERKDREVEKKIISGPIEPPPIEQLQALYEMAISGDIAGIEERTVQIEHMDMRFIPFVAKLRNLTKEFKDTQIVAFIKGFLKTENNQ